MEALSISENTTTNNSSESTDDCKICFKKRNGIFAFLPCFHAVACEFCCSKVIASSEAKCPICRRNVNQFHKIYT